MLYSEFAASDIEKVTPLYIEYYNSMEDGEWTEATVTKRLRQMVSREDAYGLLLTTDEGRPAGFVLGFFEQYDDGFAYDLIEIVIAKVYQNWGLGTELMREIERRAKKKGALLVQLQAVNDERHDRFYGRLGYQNVNNLILKSKTL